MLCLKRKQFAVLDFCIHGFAAAQLNTLNNAVPIFGQFAARNQFADARREAVIAVYLERRMSAEQIWISAAAFFECKASMGAYQSELIFNKQSRVRRLLHSAAQAKLPSKAPARAARAPYFKGFIRGGFKLLACGIRRGINAIKMA